MKQLTAERKGCLDNANIIGKDNKMKLCSLEKKGCRR